MNTEMNAMNLERIFSLAAGWLGDVGLQVTALMVIVGAVVCLRRMAAARRHFLMAGALMLIPVVMGCSFVAPVWRISWDAGARAKAAAEAEVRKKVAEEDARDPFAPRRVETVEMKATVEDEVMVSPVWVVLWLGGVGAGAMVLMFSAGALRRLRAGARVVVDGHIRRCFEEVAGEFGLRLPERCLRMSGECAVPMTWGIFEKTVLLPESAAEWSEARLRLVLRHELGHIARGDVLITLLTTVSALLMWFNPLVWVMLRACGRAREEACDDLALERSGQSAEDFAEELLAAVAGLGGGSGNDVMRQRRWGVLTLTLALAMAVSASAQAMRMRLANLVLRAGRGRGGYSMVQKAMMVMPALGVAFALSGLSACRKAEPVVPKQILVMSRFINIPKDSPLLAEAGLTLDEKVPGMQSLGIQDEKQTERLLRLLSQEKGVDLMSAPSVTTRSGQKAKVEVVREFLYPTEFDPPRQEGEGKPLIPTTPTAFQMKPVGVQMEVTPVLMEGGEIELTVTPEVTSFEGFIDYGTPITKAGEVVTENKIQQPVFHSMKATASFVMKPGQSVVFGGLGNPKSGPLHSQASGPMTSPAGGPPMSRLPEAKDLVFFIVQAKVVEAGTAKAQAAEPAVSVFGQVKRQGRYAFRAGMTVKDLLDQAQGPSERADGNWAEFRRGNVSVMIDLRKEGKKALEAEDALTVMERGD